MSHTQGQPLSDQGTDRVINSNPPCNVTGHEIGNECSCTANESLESSKGQGLKVGGAIS